MFNLARSTEDSFKTGGTPVIYDETLENYDLAGTLVYRIGDDLSKGSLVSSDLREALLSMSDPGKAIYPAVSDFDASRPAQDPVFLAYDQPSFSQPHSFSPSTTYSASLGQAPYGGSGLYLPSAPPEESQASFDFPSTRQLPRITSYAPQQGSQGVRVTINIISACDLGLFPFLDLSAVFAGRKCRSTLTKIENRGAYHQYVLDTYAPAFLSLGWANPQVPLRLNLNLETKTEGEVIEVGPFTYTDATVQAGTESPGASRKRKVSWSSTDFAGSPSKRSLGQHLRRSSVEGYEPYSQEHDSSPLHLQRTHLGALVDSPVATSALMPYRRSQSQQSFREQDSPRQRSGRITIGSRSPVPQMAASTPLTPGWGSAQLSTIQEDKSNLLSTGASEKISASKSPSARNPPLIRTSTLPLSPEDSGSNPASGSAGGGTFKPYGTYPHKAILKINGDLDSMTGHWSSDEYDVKRRLVQFWRSQNGNTISTKFKPMAAEERTPSTICVSCILWEAKQEYYVTSVDAIFLLESLVAVRFTVEEKNRIRRNLEGFRPMTVSKGKSDSEEFFKLIMGFPNPKPRNIEKDVKVFPWKILAHALKKIIGKYSASYSSTAGALPSGAQRSDPYGGMSNLEEGKEHAGEAPRRGVSESSTGSTHTTVLVSKAPSPNVQMYRSNPLYMSQRSRSIQSLVPALPHEYSDQELQYGYISHPHVGSSPAPIAMMPHPQQQDVPWDYSQYSPVPGMPPSQPAMPYHQGSLAIPSSQDPTSSHYRMTHSSRE